MKEVSPQIYSAPKSFVRSAATVGLRDLLGSPVLVVAPRPAVRKAQNSTVLSPVVHIDNLHTYPQLLQLRDDYHHLWIIAARVPVYWLHGRRQMYGSVRKSADIVLSEFLSLLDQMLGRATWQRFVVRNRGFAVSLNTCKTSRELYDHREENIVLKI